MQLLFPPLLEPLLDPLLEPLLEPLLDPLLEPLPELLLLPPSPDSGDEDDEHATDPVAITEPPRRTTPRPMR